MRLEGVDRAGYHAAAVLASNDVVALMAAAAPRLGARRAAGGGGPRAALAPLMLAAAANVRALPLERALTGPVARGDVATVERHLAALARGAGARASSTARLALELLALDLGHDAGTARALRALLAPGD